MQECDIVARLRLYAERQKQTRSTVLGLLLSDSADEIERLRAELRKYTGDAHATRGNECTQSTQS